MTNPDQIYILKTNIDALCGNCPLYKALDQHSEISHWTIDLEDFDKVLRVVSATLSAASVINIVRASGFKCEELN